MRRFLAVLALLAGLLGVMALPPASAAPYCGIRWGSLPEQAQRPTYGEVTDVRTGRHGCFDRLVLDVDGKVGGYTVSYVRQVRLDGSGFVLPVRGGARLQVTANAGLADPTDPRFRSGRELADVTGYRTFRQVVSGSTFEGYTTLGLGVRARLPFRVFILDGPGDASRLVVDVAHRW